MYNIIQNSHSGIMWPLLSMMVISIVVSAVALVKNQGSFSLSLYKITKYLIYLQLILGAILMFISPKVQYVSGFMKEEALRFYGMEHPLMMIIALSLVSFGILFAKKKTEASKKNRTILIYYTIATAIIAYMIPWASVMA